jgi:hypothetical protein
MATRPSANTSVSSTAGASAGGDDLICVWAPVKANADLTPRLFGSWAALYAFHDYSEGLEYSALHIRDTGLPVLFLGLPIDAEGTIGPHDTTGNTDTCVTTVVEGSGGCLGEHAGVLKVKTGGTIGTDQIVLELSLDAGVSFKTVRLGTATSYVIPYFNVTISFAAGDLTAGETIHTWQGSGPRSEASDWTAAREALAAQPKGFRSVLLCGDIQDSTEAGAFRDELNAYETANDRFVYGRCSILDRVPLASLSATSVRMTGAPSLTFAEVGATGDTITRAAGSWVSDGLVDGDLVTVTGSASNNVSGVIDALSATVITFDDTDLAAEITAAATVVAEPALTFDDTGETITRNRGSWLADGFRVWDSVTISGTSGGINDGTFTITVLTALVMTFGAGSVDADEVIGATDVTIAKGQTKAAWMAEVDAEFAEIDSEKRIDMAAGRGRRRSPVTGWNLRRSPAWAASIREYQHDLHTTTWRKADGPTGFSLLDTDNNTVEWDDRVDGGAGSAARFTTFTSWANGPAGAFITQSLTRAGDGDLLSYTHNMAVVNKACTTVQTATEDLVGRTIDLNDDGTATTEELNTMRSTVNAELELALLQNVKGEGTRVSSAVWEPSTDNILNVAEAVLTGVLTLNLKGTIHTVNTTVAVRQGGQ